MHQNYVSVLEPWNLSPAPLLTYLFHGVTYLLIPRSRETNRFLASAEVPRILWNLKIHYRIHKCPSHVRILSQIDPVHALTSLLLKIHPNTFLPPTPGSSKWVSCTLRNFLLHFLFKFSLFLRNKTRL